MINSQIETPLIIIGGFLFNQKPLQPLINKLANQYNKIYFIDINLINNLGSLNDLCEIIYKQISNLNRTNLLGWSLGGLIALKLAMLYPQQFEKVILLNSSPKFIAENNWGGIKQNDFNNLYNKLIKVNHINFAKYFIRLANYPNKQYLDYINQINSTLPLLKLDQLINSLQILNSTDLRAEMLKSNLNLLAIYGSNDILVPYNKLPFKQVIINNSPHIINSHIDEIGEQIIGFLNDK